MKQLIMVGVLVVVTGVLVQWGHVMMGVVVGIAATIMLFHQRNQVDIEGAVTNRPIRFHTIVRELLFFILQSSTRARV